MTAGGSAGVPAVPEPAGADGRRTGGGREADGRLTQTRGTTYNILLRRERPDVLDSLLADLKKGKRGAVARAISMVENDQRGARAMLKKIFKHTGKSIVVGITGPAGAGKSSLINRTAAELGRLKARPAVLAVDPTSHLTGGAILGDRVRMAESADSGTYIRSIASRGSTGAVSRSLRNIIRVLEYAGFDPIIVESVGAGQTEVGISNIADVTVVVFNPHTGDSIQAIKAGLTEIGDVYLVNKSDLDGASRLFDAMCDHIGASGGGEGPVILKTSAKRNSGIKEFARRLKDLMAQKRECKRRTEPARLEAELREIVLNDIGGRVDAMLDSDRTYASVLKRLGAKSLDPFEAADRVSRSIRGRL